MDDPSSDDRDMPRKSKPSLVQFVGTPDDVVALLKSELALAQDDETLALAVVAYRRGGIVEAPEPAGWAAFWPQLVAGTEMLKRLLLEEE